MGTLPRTGRVEVVTEADPEAVWAVVSDPTRVGEWSHECGGAEWVGDVVSARPGARFRRQEPRRALGVVAGQRGPHRRRTEIVLVADRPVDALPGQHHLEHLPRADRRGTRIVQTFQVVKLNPAMDRLFFCSFPQHRDRSEALTADLQRLGEVARAG